MAQVVRIPFNAACTGMSDGDLSSFTFTASSERTGNEATQAALADAFWSTETLDANQWLQVINRSPSCGR